jgi:Raf kinase inhibitor-like YbhB/YbcL family protein
VAIGGENRVMKLTSPEFNDNEFIPKKFTRRGENINPELIIDDIPAGTQSIALICDDPDAPGKDWVHWVVFNIPVTAKIEENSSPGKQGVNDFGRNGYDGPCPPFGTHRYIFKIYALDTELDLEEGISKADLERAMEGHILARAELIGLYKK